MKNIFLSASIPAPTEHPYSETADPLLIHSAVRSLCILAFGHKKIIWGGHPAITPMMWAACENLGLSYAKTVHLYQSKFFSEEDYPEENEQFQNVTYVDAGPDRETSLRKMRYKMLASHRFEAGVFIGGMQGVVDEFRMFTELHPKATVILFPSTGGAAKLLAETEAAEAAPAGDFVDFIGYLSDRIKITTPNRRLGGSAEPDDPVPKESAKNARLAEQAAARAGSKHVRPDSSWPPTRPVGSTKPPTASARTDQGVSALGKEGKAVAKKAKKAPRKPAT